ncbi:MAG: sigma-70 family RNA polymerase sigma factor, partial [Candidatus Dormibacter sp.]
SLANHDQGAFAALEAAPEDSATAQEAATLVWTAAAGLEPRQRAVLNLSLRQELTNPEIAQVLRVRTSEASLLVHRALIALNEAVGKDTALGMASPESIFATLAPLPLPLRLRTSPAVTRTAAELALWDSPLPPPGAAPPGSNRPHRRRRSAVLVATVLVLISAIAALALTGVLGNATPAVSTTSTVPSATPSAVPTATPTAAPTVPPTNAVAVPPTATPLPVFGVTAISLCFVAASGACNPANTTLATCTQSAGAAPRTWQCRFRVTFSLARGSGGPLDWSLAGTLRAGCSAPAGVSTGGRVTVGDPSPGQVTISGTLTLASRNPDRPGAPPSSATVTSPQGRGAAHNTAGFYGTGNCA